MKKITSIRLSLPGLSAFLFFLGSFFQAQTSYTFTNAGATGSVGPSQAQINTAYASTNLNGSVVAAGGIQSFTIPVAGNYKIEAWGAAGGTQLYSPGFPGGNGAYISGNFTFTLGTVLKILVGQKGGDSQGVPADNVGTGGGGGTFVYINPTDPFPLVAAGGGGGGGRHIGLYGANATTNGNASLWGGAGGINGNGGQQNTGSSSYWAGGGCGWLTNGTGGNNATNYVYTPGSTGAYGGRTPANGGFGGNRYNDGTDEGGDGGFGGGGGGGSDNMGSGGGGGFSGGGGGRSGTTAANTNNPTGGGGGSYNGGTSQVNTPSVNPGHGKVIITRLCTIAIYAAGTNSNGAICAGNSVTLTTDAVSNYSWSTGSNAASIVESPSVTTTYSLTAMSPSNCITSAAITISVDPAVPNLTVANTATAASGICPGNTVMLTASGATSYSWTGGVSNGVAFQPTTATSYTVTGYNACGITTAVTSVSVHPIPSLTVSITQPTVCSGNTVACIASGASTYTWSNLVPNGQAFFPGATTVYTVIGTSALSCTAQAMVGVTVVNTPILAPLATPTVICIGGSGT
ncbi:MAG TPA: glycine rich domain-containing protein, partial [Bacteroidia bacterium]|nr:glycine rich domain-containing protein [Bacteroidia bacterium]